MQAKVLWKIPVPSTALQGEQLLCTGADALLRFDYYDPMKNGAMYTAGIFFDTVVGFKHDSEGFAATLMDAYDQLVEVVDSDWLAEYRKTNSRIADLFQIKHFAIFLKSCGLYEFIAKSYAIQEVSEGGLDALF